MLQNLEYKEVPLLDSPDRKKAQQKKESKFYLIRGEYIKKNDECEEIGYFTYLNIPYIIFKKNKKIFNLNKCEDFWILSGFLGENKNVNK